ncbi:MAG: NAD(P)-dependent glycerol-3-phosphate dehydrogenase [Myxococcales bacterium]|nr:NAD(P)-dependent glycerol-3-phosphate dehydrogenase [Myxococcales bacterium]
MTSEQQGTTPVITAREVSDRAGPQNIAVIGAGSWGTGLAIHAARLGHTTRLWTRRPEHCAAMLADRRNRRYLPDVPFPANLGPVDSLPGALAGASLVILAIPSHGMRAVVEQVAEALRGLEGAPYFLIAAKGVEVESLKPMLTVVEEELPAAHRSRIAVLGGPSFAAELAAGLPTVVVVASRGTTSGPSDAATAVQGLLAGASLRVYISDDALGVELGGAFKNVIAIAAGCCDGAGLGQNARAALITRGLAEITRLSVTLGANPATLAGLAGLGDLVLTCTGGLSRNRRVGLGLGQGRSLPDILEEMGMVAEGIKNTLSAQRLAAREGVEMPITRMMHAMLYEGLSVREAVTALMQRDLKAERG